MITWTGASMLENGSWEKIDEFAGTRQASPGALQSQLGRWTETRAVTVVPRHDQHHCFLQLHSEGQKQKRRTSKAV